MRCAVASAFSDSELATATVVSRYIDQVSSATLTASTNTTSPTKDTTYLANNPPRRSQSLRAFSIPSLGSPAKKFAQEIARRAGEARAVLRSRRRRIAVVAAIVPGIASRIGPRIAPRIALRREHVAEPLHQRVDRIAVGCCCHRRTARRPCRTGPDRAHGAWHRRRRDRTGFPRRRDRCADRSSCLRY